MGIRNDSLNLSADKGLRDLGCKYSEHIGQKAGSTKAISSSSQVCIARGRTEISTQGEKSLAQDKLVKRIQALDDKNR